MQSTIFLLPRQLLTIALGGAVLACAQPASGTTFRAGPWAYGYFDSDWQPTGGVETRSLPGGGTAYTLHLAPGDGMPAFSVSDDTYDGWGAWVGALGYFSLTPDAGWRIETIGLLGSFDYSFDFHRDIGGLTSPTVLSRGQGYARLDHGLALSLAPMDTTSGSQQITSHVLGSTVFCPILLGCHASDTRSGSLDWAGEALVVHTTLPVEGRLAIDLGAVKIDGTDSADGHVSASLPRHGLALGFVLSPVPEPASWWTWVGGLAALGAWRGRRRLPAGRDQPAVRLQRLQAGG